MAEEEFRVTEEYVSKYERLTDDNVNDKRLSQLTSAIKKCNNKIRRMRKEIHKTIVGQEDIVDNVLRCILANGHALLEGPPGTAKTLLINSFASTVKNSTFKRVQFTPDLLPGDVVGVTAYNPDKGFYTVKGPCFANFLLADEINRAPPKVQSAMLELMQERQVTIGKKTFNLPKPFLVLATQNPVEQEGTFPLPEAQVDRFLFKLILDYPPEEDETYIVENNSTVKAMDEFKIQYVVSPEEIVAMQKLVKKIYLSKAIRKYIVNLIMMTRWQRKRPFKYAKYLAWGAGTRATISLFIASKANALMSDRGYVTPEDVRAVIHPVLRHRVILNYEAKASNLSSDQVIDEIVRVVPVY